MKWIKKQLSDVQKTGVGQSAANEKDEVYTVNTIQ